MICRVPLPAFDLAGAIDAPLPDAAVEAIAALLLAMVDQKDNEKAPPSSDRAGQRKV